MKSAGRFYKMVMALTLAVVMCMGLAGLTSVAMAYETTYTVRILPGAQSTMGPLVYENMSYGSTITFDVSSVPLIDSSSYYVKGLKDSGMDNNHYTSDFAENRYLQTDGAGHWFITVTKDQDFVVSYGLLGNSVSYRINYVDEQGNQLAESSTYYGNVGDSPVISYLYINGYQPQQESLSVVLSANPDENVFSFVYSEVVYEQPTTAAPATTATTTTTTTGGGGVTTVTAVPTVPTNTGGAAAADDGTAATAGGDAAANGPTVEGGVPAVPTPDMDADGTGAGDAADGANAAGGADDGLIDIDDNDTPLARTAGTIQSGDLTYDGFHFAKDTGKNSDTPDDDGLFSLDDGLVPLAAGPGGSSKVDRPTRSRYAVYNVDGSVMFEYKYLPIPLFEGMTAFPGEAGAQE